MIRRLHGICCKPDVDQEAKAHWPHHPLRNGRIVGGALEVIVAYNRR